MHKKKLQLTPKVLRLSIFGSLCFSHYDLEILIRNFFEIYVSAAINVCTQATKTEAVLGFLGFYGFV